MGVGAALAGIGSLASGGAAIANAVGGSGAYGTYGGNPGAYIPTGQAQADQYYQNIYGQMLPYATNLPGQVIPGYQAYSTNIQQNPFAGQELGGAQTVSGYGAQGAQALQGAGGQVLNTAFDPQTALYNQLQQQTTDQANAANAAAGVSGPYAAGTTDQALQNFNIAWQNQQLARQQQGIQAAGQAYTGAQGLGTQAASLPYNTYLGQQQTDIGALQSLIGGTSAAFGPSESLANLLQSYLGLGQSATGLAQQGQGASFAQNQLLGQQFGQSLNQLGNLFSGSSFPGSSAGGSLSGTNFWGNPTDMYLSNLSYASAAAPGSDQVIPM